MENYTRMKKTKEPWKKEGRKDERNEGRRKEGRKEEAGLVTKPGWIHIWTKGKLTSKCRGLKDGGLEEEQVDVKRKEKRKTLEASK